MDFENVFADALHAAAADVRPDTVSLAGGGVERGRRARARRRVTTAVACAVAVAAVGVGVPHLASGSTPTAPAGKVSPTPATTSASRGAGIEARLAHYLSGALAPMTLSGATDIGTGLGHYGVRAVYSDQHGSGLVTLTIAAGGTAVQGYSSPMSLCTASQGSCTEILYYNNRFVVMNPPDARSRTVALALPTGIELTLTMTDARSAGGPTTRSAPVPDETKFLAYLSGNELLSIASSAPAAPTVSAGPSESTMTRAEMLDALGTLLPGANFTDVRTDTGPGALEVDYNDGHGAVDLMLYITGPGAPGLPATCPTPLWKDEGPRPAGALPISCAMRTPAGGGSERDAVSYADVAGFYGYMVTYVNPSGMKVDIQVGNGLLHTLPQPDRATPPGTLSLWESVVESSDWHL